MQLEFAGANRPDAKVNRANSDCFGRGLFGAEHEAVHSTSATFASSEKESAGPSMVRRFMSQRSG
jgi:hypothetical protein